MGKFLGAFLVAMALSWPAFAQQAVTVSDTAAQAILDQVADNTDVLNELSEPAVQGNAFATAPDGIPFMLGAVNFDGTVIPEVVTEGQYVRPAASLYGVQMFLPTTDDGSKSPLALEDSAAASLGAGFRMFFTRCDTAAASGANGDLVDPCTTSAGELWVRDTNSGAMANDLNNLSNTLVVEDDAEIPGNFLMPVGLVRRDAAASSAGTTGDSATANVDALGLLWTRQLDPCSGVAKTYIPIDIVTLGTTELTPALAGSGNYYYICAINLVTAGANNVALVYDNDDNCGSVTAGVMGGFGSAAEGWNFAANGGLTLGNGGSSVGRTAATNVVLCAITSANVQLSGHLVVAAAP